VGELINTRERERDQKETAVVWLGGKVPNLKKKEKKTGRLSSTATATIHSCSFITETKT